jgi:hypothetical protein
LQFVAGGMSAVAAALLRFIAQQSIEEGIWIQQVCRKFRIWSLVADYDALRMVYNSKGAAASKPCMQCKNICGNWMSLPETDPYFHSIDCADFRNFDMISNAELHHAFDTLKPNLATWRKKQRENTEKGLVWGTTWILTACFTVRLHGTCFQFAKYCMTPVIIISQMESDRKRLFCFRKR